MSHKVFICYDPNDEEISSDLSTLLELNDIKTWLKSKDYNENNTVYDITNAIRSSECVVLVYSKDAKKSDYVTTEIDIAFSSNIPILIFKIDDTPIDGKIGFYLKDKPLIEASNPKEKYSDLLIDVKNILNKEKSSDTDSAEDLIIPTDDLVFICYDDKDEEYANAICHTLEENKIKCWIKNRDLSVNDTVFNIKEHLESSKVFLLIHSANSAKSNYVNTDIDIAMENNIPIVLYKIDKYTLASKLKEYVGANRLDAYPDVNSELENLVKTTSEILKNPVKKPIVKKIPKVKEETEEKTPTKPEVKTESKGFFNKKTIAIIGIIAVILAIVGIYALGIIDSGNSDTGDVKFEVKNGDNSTSGVKITKCNIKDQRNNTEYSWSYSYFAYGTLSSNISSNEHYKVNVSFYDSDGKFIDSSLNDIKDLKKVNDRYILGYCFLDSKNVKKIVVTVQDNGNILAQDEYTVSS